jgi:uncharacterized C2H2 Zn-finger protein
MRRSIVRQPHEEDRLIAESSMSDWDRTVVATSAGGTTVLQQDCSIALHCETCGAAFATGYALHTHLRDAYHGFQCLHCGALFARRGQMNEHACQDQQGWQDTLHVAVSDWIRRYSEHDPSEVGHL